MPVMEIFSLCDAATSENGKLNILGAFDTIWVRQFPAVYPHCTVAIRLRFLSAEKGEHTVTTRLIDADGKNALPPASGVVQIQVPDGQSSAPTNIVLNIQSLKLEKPGEFSIEMAVDGHGGISLPLFVKNAP